MVRAQKLARYHDMQPFTPPSGVVAVKLDKASNLPADDSCPDDYQAYFVDGTVPAATCSHPEGPKRSFFDKMFGIGKHPQTVLPPITEPAPPVPTAVPASPDTLPTQLPASPPQPKKKRGFWHRLFGGGKKNDTATSTDTTLTEPH